MSATTDDTLAAGQYRPAIACSAFDLGEFGGIGFEIAPSTLSARSTSQVAGNFSFNYLDSMNRENLDTLPEREVAKNFLGYCEASNGKPDLLTDAAPELLDVLRAVDVALKAGLAFVPGRVRVGMVEMLDRLRHVPRSQATAGEVGRCEARMKAAVKALDAVSARSEWDES